jgi:hypothetical protein
VARTLLLLGFGFCSLAVVQPAAAQTPAPPPADWRFAHPDADMRVGLNLQAILNSPAVMKAIEQGKAQAKDNAMQVQLVLAMLKTVDRISVSANLKAAPAGAETADKTPAENAASDMDVLVQVSGSFDSQLIAGFFPSTGTAKVKVVGPHTILIGEGDSFAKAAERMASGAPVRGDELEQNDVWLSVSSDFIAKQAGASGLPVSTTQANPLLGLLAFSLGLNLGEAPEINLLVTAKDKAAAGEMLKTLEAGVGQAGQINPLAGAAAKAMSMKQDGSRIRVHYVVPPELMGMVQQLAQEQATSGALPQQLAPLLGMLGMGGPASAAKPAAGATAPAPAPKNDGKIKIYGLDDGTKEIPAK